MAPPSPQSILDADAFHERLKMEVDRFVSLNQVSLAIPTRNP